MKSLEGTGWVGKYRARGVWSLLGGLALLGALGLVALDTGAAPVAPVESGAGAENGRNVATVNLPGIAGITPFSVRSFSLGGERPESTAGSLGRFIPKLLTLVKPIDGNTPALFALATGGNNINTLTITVPAAGVSAAITYTLSGLVVIGDSHSDKGRATSGQSLEEVSFTYRRLQMQVGNVVRCFDFGNSTSC